MLGNVFVQRLTVPRLAVRRLLFVGLLVVCISTVNGQVYQGQKLRPDSTNYANVYVKKMYSDSLSSTFVIWIKNEVKPHKHVEHTEVITVLQGKAEMTLNGKKSIIKRGDVVIIPKGTVHSVITKSKKPLVVVSVQAPEFKGKDRVWIEEKKK